MNFRINFLYFLPLIFRFLHSVLAKDVNGESLRLSPGSRTFFFVFFFSEQKVILNNQGNSNLLYSDFHVNLEKVIDVQRNYRKRQEKKYDGDFLFFYL